MTDKEEKIAATTEKLDKLAQEAAPLTARTQAYRRIINLTKRGLLSYYERFPERAVDARSQDAEDWSVRGIQDVMRVLDDYNIEYKDGQPTPAKSDVHVPTKSGG